MLKDFQIAILVYLKKLQFTSSFANVAKIFKTGAGE